MRPAITIGNAYPWGRSFDEYRRMFALSEEDLNRRIIACADGPAAFNCEMARRGRRVVSCDPLYRHGAGEIRSRVKATRNYMVSWTRQNADRFVWDSIGSPEKMGRLRLESMMDFLADYESGREEDRYVEQSLPSLDFPDGAFDLALCSHFLFLYSDDFSLEFHVASALEMCRLAGEARIFPLLDLSGRISRHLHPLLGDLGRRGLDVAIEPVSYEVQRGGNQMLRIRRGEAWTRS